MVVNDDKRRCDIVFVVEASARLERHFSDLRNLYLKPILSQFNPSFGDDAEICIDCHSNLYTMVTFNSNEAAPNLTVSQPTRSSHEIFEAFSLVQFKPNQYNPQNHVTEALALSLQVIDDYHMFRKAAEATTDRYIILVCNSYHYEIPVSTIKNYRGQYIEQLLHAMTQKQVNLSIICPQKRPQLTPLFKHVANPAMPALNYAHNPRHQVLIHNLNLPELPRRTREESIVIELDKSPNPGQSETATSQPTSILVEQIKEAQTHRPLPAPPQSQPSSRQSAPLLSDILDGPPGDTSRAPLTGMPAHSVSNSSIGAAVSLPSSQGYTVQMGVGADAQQSTSYHQVISQSQYGTNTMSAAPGPRGHMPIGQSHAMGQMMSQNQRPVMSMTQSSVMSQRQMNPQQSQQMMPTQQPNMSQQQPTLPQQSMMSQQSQPMNSQPNQPMLSQQQNPSMMSQANQSMMPQRNQPMSQHSQSMLMQQQQPVMSQQAPAAAQPTNTTSMSHQSGLPAQLQVIWQGVLEVNDKKAAGTIPAADRAISLSARFLVDPQVDGDLTQSGGLRTWPQHLQVIPIPDIIISQSQKIRNLIGSNSRSITIQADTAANSRYWDVVKTLNDRKMAGVITQSRNANNPEHCIMLVLLTKNTTTPTLRAFLPKQQSYFYEEFKNSVNSFKQRNPRMVNSAGNVPQRQMNPAMAMGNMQARQQEISAATQVVGGAGSQNIAANQMGGPNSTMSGTNPSMGVASANMGAVNQPMGGASQTMSGPGQLMGGPNQTMGGPNQTMGGPGLQMSGANQGMNGASSGIGGPQQLSGMQHNISGHQQNIGGLPQPMGGSMMTQQPMQTMQSQQMMTSHQMMSGQPQRMNMQQMHSQRLPGQGQPSMMMQHSLHNQPNHMIQTGNISGPGNMGGNMGGPVTMGNMPSNMPGTMGGPGMGQQMMPSQSQMGGGSGLDDLQGLFK